MLCVSTEVWIDECCSVSAPEGVLASGLRIANCEGICKTFGFGYERTLSSFVICHLSFVIIVFFFFSLA